MKGNMNHFFSNLQKALSIEWVSVIAALGYGISLLVICLIR